MSEAAEFVSIEENELVSLRRIIKQLPEVKQRYHDRRGEELKQLQLISTFNGRKRFQESTVEPTNARLEILSPVQTSLPDLISTTEVALTLAKERLIIIHDDQKKREADSLESWLHHVVPASDSYAHIVSRFKKAVANYLDSPN